MEVKAVSMQIPHFLYKKYIPFFQGKKDFSCSKITTGMLWVFFPS